MAFIYNLESCNPSLYPDIDNLGHPTPHPYDTQIVFINQAPINSSQTYKLVAVALSKVYTQVVPPLSTTELTSCSDVIADKLWRLKNCDTGEEIRAYIANSTATQGAVISLNNLCGCWLVVSQVKAADVSVSLVNSYSDCEACLLGVLEADLEQAEQRTKSFAVKIKLPEDNPVDRGFSKCCYENLVLADTTSSDPYKNDFVGAYYKKQAASDTVTFKLVDVSTTTEYNLNSGTYGTYQAFGGVQADLSFVIVDWKLVLSGLGAGTYQIKKELNIAGIVINKYSDTYTLKQFSQPLADKTVRIDSFMYGRLVKEDVDFTDTNYKTSMRLRGFFGRAEYSFEQDNIAKRDYSYLQNTMSNKREYQFQGLQLPECITEELFNFILFGNELFISDYNGNNHSYKYELMPVKLEGNKGTEFFVTDRGVNVNLTFSDRTENSRKLNC